MFQLVCKERSRSVSSSDGIDKKKFQQSMFRLGNIFKDIATKADESMNERCPYKDSKSMCNAKFGCRNQYFRSDPVSLPICTGSDSLDYRSAWESSDN